jgi:hypothetical protein
LHAPKLAGNLVSIGQLADRGISCNFTAAGAHLSRDGEGLAFARRVGRNYVLEPTREAYTARMSTANNDSYRLWYRRLGHAGEEKMCQPEKATLATLLYHTTHSLSYGRLVGSYSFTTMSDWTPIGEIVSSAGMTTAEYESPLSWCLLVLANLHVLKTRFLPP